VIVVEEHAEQPHVVAGGLRLLVVVRANGARRAIRAGQETSIELDVLECFDLLRLAFFGDLEIGGLQVRHRGARLVRDNDVDPDEIDAGPKHRRRLIARGRLARGRLALGRLTWGLARRRPRRLRRLLLRLLLRLLGIAAHRAQGDREQTDEHGSPESHGSILARQGAARCDESG